MSTRRLYWQDSAALSAVARVVAIAGDRVALDQTCFFPGGGGQPADAGTLIFPGGQSFQVLGIETTPEQTFWHWLSGPAPDLPPDTVVNLQVDAERRQIYSRHHTALHVVNTIALRDFDAWITGAQIGLDYSRIDFKFNQLTPGLVADLEAKVNAVLSEDHPVEAFFLSEVEFSLRRDLIRTLEAKPPIIDGRVRVVAIRGFDEQACGGTHARNTRDIGRLVIFKTENKGKINKRLYVRFSP